MEKCLEVNAAIYLTVYFLSTPCIYYIKKNYPSYQAVKDVKKRKHVLQGIIIYSRCIRKNSHVPIQKSRYYFVGKKPYAFLYQKIAVVNKNIIKNQNNRVGKNVKEI